MKTSDFDYDLPQQFIAQTPMEPRHHSRLLVYDRQYDEVSHHQFLDILSMINPGDVLVLNETRVIPARIFAHKPTGGKVEVLLLKKTEPLTWEVLVGGKRVRTGLTLKFDQGIEAQVTAELEGPRRILVFDREIEPFLEKLGEMPLPPYIHTRLENQERYQTVFSKKVGSAAAPTAGLHFTDELLQELKDKGVRFAHVDLHVGLDTFAPVDEDDPQEHKIHTEWCELDAENAEIINRTKAEGGRVIAVGTTSVRTLESGADKNSSNIVKPFSGDTNLFILPGYTFNVVDAVITNFHLPRSTLIMLVSAFAGREKILSLYQLAMQEGYRFYSFGDAMFLK